MDLTELAQQLERHGLKLIEHDGRLQQLEDDRSMVRELAEQTRALAYQPSRRYTRICNSNVTTTLRLFHRSINGLLLNSPL